MTIEKTFEWLFKRFQSPNIKPCKFDFDSLTFLAEWVNREKQNNKQQNILFAKLYAYVFIQEINHYKDLEFAQKSMNNILDLSLEKHYSIFTQKLNDFEFNKYLVSIGINPESKHYLIDESEVEKLAAAEKFFENVNKWNITQVEKSLNSQITETINRYDNKP
jgi:hypothetical protein